MQPNPTSNPMRNPESNLFISDQPYRWHLDVETLNEALFFFCKEPYQCFNKSTNDSPETIPDDNKWYREWVLNEDTGESGEHGVDDTEPKRQKKPIDGESGRSVGDMHISCKLEGKVLCTCVTPVYVHGVETMAIAEHARKDTVLLNQLGQVPIS